MISRDFITKSGRIMITVAPKILWPEFLVETRPAAAPCPSHLYGDEKSGGQFFGGVCG